jgi:hypothetical protein
LDAWGSARARRAGRPTDRRRGLARGHDAVENRGALPAGITPTEHPVLAPHGAERAFGDVVVDRERAILAVACQCRPPRPRVAHGLDPVEHRHEPRGVDAPPHAPGVPSVISISLLAPGPAVTASASLRVASWIGTKADVAADRTARADRGRGTARASRGQLPRPKAGSSPKSVTGREGLKRQSASGPEVSCSGDQARDKEAQDRCAWKRLSGNRWD